jgi:hypothetical protein
MMKFVTPFVDTPMNILRFGAQRLDLPHYVQWLTVSKLKGEARAATAFADSRNRLLRELASGDASLVTAAKGRIIAGSAIATLASAATLAGTITGRGPTDPEERKALTDSGWLPYSIKVGDTYVSYARMDPIATIMGTIADMTHATDFMPEDKQDHLTEVGMGVIVALTNNFTNKSFLQGLSNFFDLMHSPDRAVKTVSQSFLSSFVPNIAKDIANASNDIYQGDETTQEVRSILDAVMAKVPGLSATLESERNVLGEKVKRITSAGSAISPLANLFVPVATRKGGDPVLEEMANRHYGWSRPPSIHNGADLVDFKNAQGQSAYDRWLEKSGTVKINGLTLRQALDGLIKSPRYLALSPHDSSDLQSPRINALKTLINRYRASAYSGILNEYPDLAAQDRQYNLNKIALRQGREPRSLFQ